jgi:hypothetical protein
MKNALKVALLATGIFSFTFSQAQTHKDDNVGHKISHGAKVVGHKTSHIAASGASAVVDKRYSGKYGPGGQTVYINKSSKYYYVDKKGHRAYLTKSQLRNKRMK